MPIAILQRPPVQPMPTRNVVITQHQSDLVDRLVATGRYQNASEVLRDGLRLVEAREADEAARLAALREAVQVGIRSEEHTSELQSLMRSSYAVFCLKQNQHTYN